ncbi:MAG: roadblock/LC7 domain-containing protein [Candidatus Thorarchaeota archaeon]
MNESSDNNNINSREVSLILDDLKENGKLTGVMFVNRNGEKIDEKIEEVIDSKILGSMCASVLESAIGLGETIGSQRVVKIIAELEEGSLIIVEIKEILSFLVLIVNKHSDVTFFLNQLDNYIQKLISFI